MRVAQTVILLVIFLHATEAMAYIGPGMGVGAFVAAFGIFGAILLTIISLIYYPIKRILKRLLKIRKTRRRIRGKEEDEHR